MGFDYWYDDAYGYNDYLSVDGYSGLFDGFGSLLGDLFGGGYYDDYDYDCGWGGDDYFSVDYTDGTDDYSLLDSVFGLFDGVLSVDGYGYSSGSYGLLDSIGSLLGGLFSDDYYYGGYDYGYDDYGYDYDYEEGNNEFISVDSSDALADLSGVSGLESILGLLGGSDSVLSVDGGLSGLDLSSVLGLLGGSEASGLDLGSLLSLLGGSDSGLSVDSGLSGLDLGSLLGLLGGSGTNISVEDTSASAASSGLDLSSILGLLGGSSTTISGSTAAATSGGIDLSSILSLLGGSGTSLSVDGLSGIGNALSGLATLYGGIADLGNAGSNTWDDLAFLDDLTNVLPNAGDSAVSSSGGFDLSSILSLLGGSGSTISVDGGTASASAASSGIDLSSILSLLGGSGSTISVDGGTASASAASNGIDLSSILNLLGGSGSTISVDGGTASASAASSGIDLSSILSLLGGSGTSLSVDGLSGIGNALSGLATLYGGIADLGNAGSNTWDDLAFLDDLTSVLPNAGDSAVSSSGGFDLSSILSLLGGSGSTISVDGGTASASAASSGNDLSSILSLLGGSGSTISGSTAAATSGGIDLSSILGLLGGSESSGLDLSSILSLLGGSESSGLDLSSILGLLGGSESSGLDLSSILGLLGGSESSGLDLSSILGLLGGSESSGLDLSSILGLLGGSDTVLSVDSGFSGLDLSSILGLLGGSDTALSVDGGFSGLDLSSILGLLGGSVLSLGTDENTFDGSFLQDLLDKLTNGNAHLKIDISLDTDDGSSSFLYDGLLSDFIATVTSDLGNLDASTTFAPEMTVYGMTPIVDELIAGAEQLIGSVLDPVLSWGDGNEAAAQGYWVEIAGDSFFDDAIRVFTSGTSLDVNGSAGAFSCRAAVRGSEFTTNAAEWTAEAAVAPRQFVSNANGLADVFFASPAKSDVWRGGYKAGNALTGETALIAGKNRIRDTFSGSSSDANILYLTDTANGDALFMDDVYSEFGTGARLNLIREIRAGAGNDVVDMTSGRYTAELAGMTVRGGAGNDVLWGANGGNMLFGDDGDDRITGGSGADIIAGGAGNDVLNGGGGSDLFAFGENWGDDVVSQVGGGSVELWFAEDESQIAAVELDGDVVFRNADGTSSVTVRNAALADLKVHFGGDQSAYFTGLAAAGAFLASTTESVFENQAARTQGILASL
jgi:hypothetical protein